jgi:putative spermidine/putrescine transport system ATP-binding protein
VLDLLAGFVRPAAGEVLLEGRPAAGLPPHRRGLGLVLRDDGPLPHLTVAGSIGFALAARRDAGGHQSASAILQALGLAGLGDRRAGALSPEQRVRAALARALAGRPRLVLLDEPFTGLDAPARDAVLGDLLPALTAAGAACVLATSDAALALALGWRAAVLESGALLQSGPAQELYDQPATARVARLLGEANCLPGRVESVEGDIARVRLDCCLEVEAAAAAMSAGSACLVFIRPERVAIATGAAAAMGEGALPAIITGLAWRGDHVHLTLALGGPSPATLVVTRPAGVPLAGLAPGQAAAIAWQARHARVLG